MVLVQDSHSAVLVMILATNSRKWNLNNPSQRKWPSRSLTTPKLVLPMRQQVRRTIEVNERRDDLLRL